MICKRNKVNLKIRDATISTSRTIFKNCLKFSRKYSELEGLIKNQLFKKKKSTFVRVKLQTLEMQLYGNN